jgi:PAS domain S-box-containing protein
MHPATIDPIDELPLPYVEVDARGFITRANRASIALHHVEGGQLVGKMAWDLVATDEKDPSYAAYCSSIQSGEKPMVVERSLYDRSGQFRTYEIHRSLVRDSDGNPAGMQMLCVDVTETKKALEDARGTSLQLQSVVDAICEAVIVTDSVGFIRSVNPAAEKLLGWEASALIGISIEEGLPIVAYLPGGRSECLFTVWLERPMKGIATILDRKRREIDVGIGASPILDKQNGSTIGVALLVRKLEISR